jgi:hypothetical protein
MVDLLNTCGAVLIRKRSKLRRKYGIENSLIISCSLLWFATLDCVSFLMNLFRTLAGVCAPFALVSCMTMQPLVPGADRASVERTWGIPTRVVQTTTGERWEYSSAPYGRVRNIARFGKDGKLVQSGEVLNIAQFSKLRPGMSRDEVEDLIGAPYWPMVYNGLPEITNLIWRWQDNHNWMCFAARFNNKTWILIDSGWYLEEKPAPDIGLSRTC